MAGEITLSQLLRTPTVIKTVSRVRAPGTLLQDFYGLATGGSAAMTKSGADLGWDIFDNTRTIASARARGATPGTTSTKPVGHVGATALRLYEKIPIEFEKVFRTRPLGAQYGTVDKNGQSYVARQIKYLTTRFKNAREFAVSRMFRGGFSITVEGENHYLTELGAGTVDIDMQLPATHKSQLDLGTGSDIITASWATDSTDVIGQILNINAAFERLHGWPLAHIWINSNTFRYLLDNTDLINVGGTAFRIWDTMSRREMNTTDASRRQSGFDVVFRALPLQTFHVYDAVLSASQYQPELDTTAGTSKIIPDNYAIFTPEPSSDWCGVVNGSEMIRERVNGTPMEVFGLHTWTMPTVDPPGWELRALDNFLPALFVPKCVAYGEVIFT